MSLSEEKKNFLKMVTAVAQSLKFMDMEQLKELKDKSEKMAELTLFDPMFQEAYNIVCVLYEASEKIQKMNANDAFINSFMKKSKN